MTWVLRWWRRGPDPEADASRVAATPLFAAPGEAGRVLAALRGVVDPETGVDIVAMGLVRGVDVDDGRARVTLTLTTAGCPMGPVIVAAADAAVRRLGLSPTIDVEAEPPWSPEQMERRA